MSTVGSIAEVSLPILKHEERIGTVLAGRFRLDAILGRGGMGVVFKGEDTSTGAPVAVKLLNYEYAERKDVVSRFMREARTMIDLAHPHIVGVIDCGQDSDGTVYLALEFLDGQSLGDRLAELGVLGVVEAADILLPVMDALAHAHAHGVIHRDLKPDNIYVTRGPDGKLVPKLLDFGIAKTLDKDVTALTKTGFVLGTPEYMSPEQAQGRSVDAAADIYSMGVVFYECLSGTLPTGDLDGPAILVATAMGKTIPLAERAPWLPKNVVDVITKALQVDPNERFKDMARFAAAMAQACGIVRKSGDVRPPAGTIARRKTQMGLRDPVVKNSSPSLLQFDDKLSQPLPFGATAASTETMPRVAPRSGRWPLLWVTGAVLGLFALGVGGAVLIGKRASPMPMAPSPSEPEPSAASVTDASPSAAIDHSPDASSTAVMPVVAILPTQPEVASGRPRPGRSNGRVERDPATPSPSGASASATANPSPSPSAPPETTPRRPEEPSTSPHATGQRSNPVPSGQGSTARPSGQSTPTILPEYE
jgi:serine/threonine-protein kinase